MGKDIYLEGVCIITLLNGFILLNNCCRGIPGQTGLEKDKSYEYRLNIIISSLDIWSIWYSSTPQDALLYQILTAILVPTVEQEPLMHTLLAPSKGLGSTQAFCLGPQQSVLQHSR